MCWAVGLGAEIVGLGLIFVGCWLGRVNIVGPGLIFVGSSFGHRDIVLILLVWGLRLLACWPRGIAWRGAA